MVPLNESSEAETNVKEVKKKKKMPLFLVIVLILFLVLAGTAAGFYFIGGGIPFLNIERAGTESVQPPRYNYSMKEFQVNLADPVNRRFLRTTIDLAYDDRSLTREIQDRESELRSHIISILRSKEAVDLQEPGGMENLELELRERLNSILDTGEVRAIYYKEFIYQ